MTLHMLNSFVPAIADTLGDLNIALEAKDARSHRIAAELANKVRWQVDTLNAAVNKHYAAFAPAADPLDDEEWIAQAVRRADVLAYNLSPVAAFTSPDDSTESWDSLRQAVPYIAFIKTGTKNYLCRVVSDQFKVAVTKLISGDRLDLPATRLKWRGKNLRVRLASGLYTYAVVFVSTS